MPGAPLVMLLCPRPARTASADALRLPRSQAWLNGLLPGEATSYGSQLQVPLDEPQMTALLTAARQVAASCARCATC